MGVVLVHHADARFGRASDRVRLPDRVVQAERAGQGQFGAVTGQAQRHLCQAAQGIDGHHGGGQVMAFDDQLAADFFQQRGLVLVAHEQAQHLGDQVQRFVHAHDFLGLVGALGWRRGDVHHPQRVAAVVVQADLDLGRALDAAIGLTLGLGPQHLRLAAGHGLAVLLDAPLRGVGAHEVGVRDLATQGVGHQVVHLAGHVDVAVAQVRALERDVQTQVIGNGLKVHADGGPVFVQQGQLGGQLGQTFQSHLPW